jgi:beta-galactosidase GanA
MVDVYDPAFAASTDSTIAAQVEPYKDNSNCIGYFVDNEIGWETIRTGTLASPVDQPCRVAFVETLKAKYGTIGALNTAWGVDASDWDTLRNPAFWKGAAEDDMNAFIHAFARRYFEAIRDALRAHAPHQLYLGCRFATAPPQAVQACAEVADVVSYNLYYRYVPCEKWSGANDLGKPIIIGEFHFGALDRGMFHTGLREAPDQATRAEYFRNYVRSVAECPAFVGCHWFQYVDEPLTGRVYDGENYAIGFVSVTDTPYAEMVHAAQEISGRIYSLRTAIGRK